MSEAKDTIVVSSEAAAAAAEEEKSDEAKAGDESGKLKELAKTVVNAGSPVAKRMHAVFLLRQMAGKEAIEALAQGNCSFFFCIFIICRAKASKPESKRIDSLACAL